MSRPVVVLGAGVLGRRIASVFVAGGYTVHIRDPSTQALHDAANFVNTYRDGFTALVPEPRPECGRCETFINIPHAVKNAWLVIEAIPEQLPLKIETFAEVDQHAPADCIIASNSSSFKSRLMLDKVADERRERVLNMHFTMPPSIRTVELMTDGETKPELFEALSTVLTSCGMIPVTARKESTGFIFNRLWAAIKREIMFILAEEVSSAEEIDLLWKNMFQLPTSLPPCRLMDQIGLDTVAFIEDNYVQERGLDATMTVDWLRENYISKGQLGLKSEKGGLYKKSSEDLVNAETQPDQLPDLYVLDVGLGANNAEISQIPTAGRILSFDQSTGKMTPLVTGQSLPDGVDISHSTGRMFWTNMGRATSTHDGSVHSAKLDGTDIQTVLKSGTVHTPKQLVVDDDAGKLYFCDREGMSVHRCNFDGSGHEILVKAGNFESSADRDDLTRWCVGITLDKSLGHIYWTQKGPSKFNRGRIFRAGVEMPHGQTAENRADIELLLDQLPEPIDLEFDEVSRVLYWTDRGEHPFGCSLNRVDLSGSVDLAYLQSNKEIISRHFNEPIGLKLGAKGEVYVTDLGGSLYRMEDGVRKLLWRDDACYTGVAL